MAAFLFIIAHSSSQGQCPLATLLVLMLIGPVNDCPCRAGDFHLACRFGYAGPEYRPPLKSLIRISTDQLSMAAQDIDGPSMFGIGARVDAP